MGSEIISTRQYIIKLNVENYDGKFKSNRELISSGSPDDMAYKVTIHLTR